MTDQDTKIADKLATAALNLAKRKKKEKLSLKDKFVKKLGPLIMERDDVGEWAMSTGKVSWWLAFLPALYIFMASFVSSQVGEGAAEVLSKDITPNHLTILLTLAGYNFGKKVASTVTKIWGKSDGPG